MHSAPPVGDQMPESAQNVIRRRNKRMADRSGENGVEPYPGLAELGRPGADQESSAALVALTPKAPASRPRRPWC